MSIEDELKRGKRTIMDQDVILRCPFLIIVPDHYRADGSCKCNEREYAIMEEWGYKWDDETKRWNIPEGDN